MSTQILLPLHTYPDGNSETLLNHATSVAAFLEADLQALMLIAEFPQVSSALGNLVMDVPSVLADARKRCIKNSTTLIEALTEKAKSSGVRMQSEEVVCSPAIFGDRAAVASRYSDLVLLGISSTDDNLRSTAEAVIFGSGRPAILLPEDHAISALDHVMIAWDGSRVAARAVNDARIFLERAAKVTVAVVTDEKALPEQSLGTRLADYLATHGLNAEHTEIRSDGQPIAEVLQDEAAKRGAGLLVMGGFGHSRMRDFVLGGATRGILQKLRMPALLSH